MWRWLCTDYLQNCAICWQYSVLNLVKQQNKLTSKMTVDHTNQSFNHSMNQSQHIRRTYSLRCDHSIALPGLISKCICGPLSTHPPTSSLTLTTYCQSFNPLNSINYHSYSQTFYLFSSLLSPPSSFSNRPTQVLA